MVLYFYSAIKNTQGQGNKVMNDNHTDWKWLGIERKGKGKFSSLYLKFHYLWWILMPTSYIYNLPRFPQGNGAEIGISIKVYRQFILSLQGITWCSFPSREEQYQQSQWLSGGDREADAHTTLLTLTMLSQSIMGSHGSDLGATPLSFSFSQTAEDGKGQYFVHLQSSVSSWASIIFQVSILSSFLVSKNTVRCGWGEQCCVQWTSVTSLCLITLCVLASQTPLKVRWWMSNEEMDC